MNNKMILPANCILLDENEMTCVNGGGALEKFLITTAVVYTASQFLPKLISFAFTSIRDFFVSYIPMPLSGKND